MSALDIGAIDSRSAEAALEGHEGLVISLPEWMELQRLAKRSKRDEQITARMVLILRACADELDETLDFATIRRCSQRVRVQADLLMSEVPQETFTQTQRMMAGEREADAFDQPTAA